MHLIVDFKLTGPFVDICHNIVSLSRPLTDVATFWSCAVDVAMMSRPQVFAVDVATSWSCAVDVAMMSRPQVFAVDVATSWSCAVDVATFY